MDANSGAAALAAARADLAAAREENGRLLDLVSKVNHPLTPHYKTYTRTYGTRNFAGNSSKAL